MLLATAKLTTPAAVLLALAAVAALTNWWAVSVGKRVVEWVSKPATMVFLIGAALVLTPADGGVRAWLVAGLVLSLAGDVFLMLPRERFVEGLVSFLLGHLAYIVGLVMAHRSWSLTLVGLGLVAVAVALVGTRIVRQVVASGQKDFVGPVIAYMAVISAMVVGAFGSANAFAAVGASLFYVSDASLAWNKFAKPFKGARLVVMSTYHLAQAGLVLSLLH